MIEIKLEPIQSDIFGGYGDVIDTAGDPTMIINQGSCARYHDRANLDFSDGRAGISIFHSRPRDFPLTIDMMERHPAGSQTFIPMSMDPFVVVVAGDRGELPSTPRAFITQPGQAINFHQGTWHGVLTPIQGTGLFAVVDRIGDGPNLEEHWFETPYTIRSLI